MQNVKTANSTITLHSKWVVSVSKTTIEVNQVKYICVDGPQKLCGQLWLHLWFMWLTSMPGTETANF